MQSEVAPARHPHDGLPRTKHDEIEIRVHRAALADTYRLTQRETEIAALIADGLALDAIAAQLGIGVGTVRNHLKRVFDKTGASSQASLADSLRGLGKWVR